MSDKPPDEFSLGGFPGEVQRHYSTRSDVQALLEPLATKLNTHLGYHKGFRLTLSLVIPFLCVLVSAAAILIAALIS